MPFLLLILSSLYFFLPAYFANMAPVLFRWLPFGSKPLHEKLFGRNKTWRGLVIAPIMGTFIFWIQKFLYVQGFTTLALIDYADFSLLLGLLLGTGAILGDLVKSYFKRKQKIESGKPWLGWDQLDFVIGGLLLSFFIYVPQIEVVVILLITSPILHVLVNYIGYLLGISRAKI
ncbi:MAG: CDP-archaeol synthase [Nanoarchaeota archaeon]